ncbi:MAG: hypothetical protein J6R32_10790, partial [Bacteroidales bacterium]|nr:hypothetical protein [Bacteroidales bacterium]
MANTEIKKLVQIDTGNSTQTVKGLKKEISDLKDLILNLENGTEEYNDAVKNLTDRQRKLDEVMSLTKKTATALEGSYDSLVHQMSLLKKEWRATNDEARRNELGKQIDELNSQLKELDAQTGNFQRNVGNYVSHWEGMPEVTKDFATSMRELNERIEPTKQGFESMQKIAAGITSGFAAVQGIMALTGAESENFEKTLIKVQAAMAVAQGVGGLKDLVEGLGKAKVAFSQVGTEVKNLSKVMGKTGWLAVILLITTAIVALVSHIKKKNQEIKDGTSALREYNKVGREAVVNAGEEVLKMELLHKVTTDVTIAMDNRRKAAEKLLTALGLEINETNILAALNGDLKTEVEDATKAMIKQAMVAAHIEKLTELYKEYLTVQAEGAQAWKDYVPFWVKYIGGATGKIGEWVFGDVDEAGENFEKRLQKSEDAYKQFAKSILENTDISALLDELFPDKDDTQKKILSKAEALKLAEETMYKVLEEDVAKIKDVEVSDTDISLEDVKGKSKQRAEILIGYAERAAKRLKEINAMSAEDERTKATKDYEINLNLLTEKLRLLEKYYQEAVTNGDTDSLIALEQQIADTEIEIERTKYDEMKRLRELDAEDRKKKK